MSNDKKPDFSNVQSKVQSTGKIEDKPDFSNVQSKVTSTGQIAGASDVGERTYTVEKGDTLSHIAKAQYGKASKWRAIFEANRDLLDDPDKIFPGQVLKIPAIDVDGDGDLD